MMLDGRWPGMYWVESLDKVLSFPSKTQTRKKKLIRAELRRLEGFPNNKRASSATDQINCLLAATVTQLQLQSPYFGPVSAL